MAIDSKKNNWPKANSQAYYVLDKLGKFIF